MRGTLDNTGRTLSVEPATPQWVLSGRLAGGSVHTAPGHALLVSVSLRERLDAARPTSASLDGVTIDGTMRVESASLVVPAGQAFVGAGDIVLASGSVYGLGDTEIGQGLTVRPATADARMGIGDATRPLVNSGTIRGRNAQLRGRFDPQPRHNRVDWQHGHVLRNVQPRRPRHARARGGWHVRNRGDAAQRRTIVPRPRTGRAVALLGTCERRPDRRRGRRGRDGRLQIHPHDVRRRAPERPL